VFAVLLFSPRASSIIITIPLQIRGAQLAVQMHGCACGCVPMCAVPEGHLGAVGSGEEEEAGSLTSNE